MTDATEQRPAPAPVKIAGTSAGAGFAALLAHWAGPYLPGFDPASIDAGAELYSLHKALVAAVLAAGGVGAFNLIAPYLPGARRR